MLRHMMLSQKQKSLNYLLPQTLGHLLLRLIKKLGFAKKLVPYAIILATKLGHVKKTWLLDVGTPLPRREGATLFYIIHKYGA